MWWFLGSSKTASYSRYPTGSDRYPTVGLQIRLRRGGTIVRSFNHASRLPIRVDQTLILVSCTSAHCPLLRFCREVDCGDVSGELGLAPTRLYFPPEYFDTRRSVLCQSALRYSSGQFIDRQQRLRLPLVSVILPTSQSLPHSFLQDVTKMGTRGYQGIAHRPSPRCTDRPSHLGLGRTDH